MQGGLIRSSAQARRGFPAACVPFGLVQAGPDTGNGTWDYCSGYRYEDKTICGFTQTHLNGTGCPDLGDISILPIAESKLRVKSGELKVGFDKAREVAEPGYYAVTLDGGITVEVAAAEHSAIYRISGKGALRLLVDCAYGIGGKNYAKTITASDVKLFGKSGLSGRNHRRQWVERDYSFVVRFSRECAAVEEMPKSEGIAAPQYVFDFDVGESPLLIKGRALRRGRRRGGGAEPRGGNPCMGLRRREGRGTCKVERGFGKGDD